MKYVLRFWFQIYNKGHFWETQRAKYNFKVKYHHTRIEDSFKSSVTTIETNRSWSETIRPGIDYFRQILSSSSYIFW